MSSRSSEKKVLSSSDKCMNNESKVTDQPGGANADRKPDSESREGERRPSSSWSVWNARGISGSTSPEPAQQGSWWHKPSLMSMRAITKEQKVAEVADSDDNAVYKVNEDPTKPSNAKTPWMFWNSNKDEAKEVLAGKETTLTSNELIVGKPYDAILFKTKSEEEAAEELGKLNSNQARGHDSNLLVPQFETLPAATFITSLYSQITKLGVLWNPEKRKSSNSLCLHRRDPQVSLNKLSEGKKRPVRVLIVGVHGFFPTKMIRPIIGEPTGTSTKFIVEAETALLRWFQKHNTHVEISKIALEKEGKVMDRVDFFFDVLKKWINEINKADFVYFVAHSQGCPVTVILLAKLIEAGIIDVDDINTSDAVPAAMKAGDKKKLISVLAMAGVNNGPFYGADQTFFVKAYSAIESASLKELFEFQSFKSVLSQKFIQSLRICIASNVKISFVGSINDQLVPLYSSTCQFVIHPNIFRATFIDKDSKTPSFITRIVRIANQLINLGYDDHGIVKEISGPLAGTLTGGGHSKIYHEGQVYELGVRFALETTDLPFEIPVKYKEYRVDQLGSNPYHLPWSMRGLLYETGVHLGKSDIDALFAEFDEWEPETKQLKNVKYRLNGLKSKL